MNPRIFASPRRVNAYASGMPYVERSFGKHIGALQDIELEQQRNEFIGNNRQILPGFGKHRASRYSSSYRVIEGAA